VVVYLESTEYRCGLVHWGVLHRPSLLGFGCACGGVAAACCIMAGWVAEVLGWLVVGSWECKSARLHVCDGYE
jgi:hypothetical protein